MTDFKVLLVWQKAHALALAVYRAASSLPEEERYGLASRLRRGSVSVVSNVAEGSGRGSDREFARFIDIARGAAVELECQLLLAGDLGYIDLDLRDSLVQQTEEVSRMLSGLRRRLRQSPLLVARSS